MAEGINPRGCGHRFRHTESQQRIENCDLAGRFLVTAGHLHVRFRLRDQGVGLGLTACSGSCRDGDHGKHGQFGFACSPVIFHLPAVAQEKVDPLRAVHAAAATQTDNEVNCVRLRDCQTAFDVQRRRVVVHIIDDGDGQLGILEDFDRQFNMPGGAQSAVGNQQDTLRSLLDGQ